MKHSVFYILICFDIPCCASDLVLAKAGTISFSLALRFSTDKKNENKSVAVDEFLGHEAAIAAIGHSM